MGWIVTSSLTTLQVYYFLTVLRCLWLRDHRPQHWDAVTKLVSNLEQRRGSK